MLPLDRLLDRLHPDDTLAASTAFLDMQQPGRASFSPLPARVDTGEGWSHAVLIVAQPARRPRRRPASSA